MPRWLALVLGCVTALGMQTLLAALFVQLGLPPGVGSRYAAQFLALVFGGYVAGHLVGEWHALNGALAAVLYIFVAATITAVREVALARQVGLQGLGPIDFFDLAISDIVAMTGACCGGWLAARVQGSGASAHG